MVSAPEVCASSTDQSQCPSVLTMTAPSLAALCLLATLCILTLHVNGESCPSPPTQPNFDVNKYLGKWYEQMRFFTVQEIFQDCVTANYSFNADGSIHVHNAASIGSSSLLRVPVSITGRATVPDTSSPAQLIVSFFNSKPSGPNYEVVETDYTKYSIVFSCQENLIGTSHTQVVWVMVRDRTGLSDAELQPILTRLRSYGIDTSRLHVTNQVGCPN